MTIWLETSNGIFRYRELSSLRPSKSIQRQVILDGVRLLLGRISIWSVWYISAFGSIWFTDFVMAHKVLGVDDMRSIEGNEIGYRRAVYNSPYATVLVWQGFSYDVLPTLYGEEAIAARPWMVWLDYDYDLNESVRDDIRSVVENAPANSILLVTFNGMENKYGQAAERPARLQQLLGAVVPDDLPKRACKDEQMAGNASGKFYARFHEIRGRRSCSAWWFCTCLPRHIQGCCSHGDCRRHIACEGSSSHCTSDIVGQNVRGRADRSPLGLRTLTIREAVSLQSQLPCTEHLSRELVQRLGFDLVEEHIESF